MQHEATDKIIKLGEPINPTADPANYWQRICNTQGLCTAANIPFLEEQKLSIAEGVFRKTGRYKRALEDWNKLAPDVKTYNNFVLWINNKFSKMKKEE